MSISGSCLLFGLRAIETSEELSERGNRRMFMMDFCSIDQMLQLIREYSGFFGMDCVSQLKPTHAVLPANVLHELIVLIIQSKKSRKKAKNSGTHWVSLSLGRAS